MKKKMHVVGHFIALQRRISNTSDNLSARDVFSVYGKILKNPKLVGIHFVESPRRINNMLSATPLNPFVGVISDVLFCFYLFFLVRFPSL